MRASHSPASRGGPRGGRGGGFLRLRGSCPLFTHPWGSRRPSSPRLSEKGRVSQGRQQHPPLQTLALHPSTRRNPPPTVPHGVAGLPAVIYRPGRVALQPALPPGLLRPAWRGLGTTPSSPRPRATDLGPLRAGRCRSLAAVIGAESQAARSPLPRAPRPRGGGKVSCHIHAPIHIFHSVWAFIKYLSVGDSGFRLLAIVDTSLV